MEACSCWERTSNISEKDETIVRILTAFTNEEIMDRILFNGFTRAKQSREMHYAGLFDREEQSSKSDEVKAYGYRVRIWPEICEKP